MKYKMICLDMDGTLLTSDKRISEKNKEYLRRIKDRGVIIAVCTGRLLISAKYFANLIGEEVDVIASNGALVIDKNDNEIYESHLGYENGICALEIMKNNNIYPHFYSRDTVYTEKMAYSSIFYQKYNEAAGNDKYKVKFNMVKNWDETLRVNENKIMKAVGMSEDINLIRKIRSQLSENSNMEVVYSHNKNFEVMKKGVSKGNSIGILAAHYGISRDEIVAFGDSNNDVSMLKYAGLGVAMGNGTKEIKENSDFITLSNDEDGVAHGIEKIFL
ncbi:Cof-type HAD-IIB family hydrolase [Oceanirhabdus sp. W0125-5]|uniref:Cof-type HAD-IIB family hydrolase n=1 Tax=Oceanirhabdus sp. W0125-5 TaxID=2999116 RepID=UPI0022F32E52|nr:Cof-type HAD-IIB family hydrolase [Oceanirhabdus sp. W0125-5]WBW98797.1 Cof-type HAD-IIB family hydrolase [Oceanirhabdus sp. W0125-5]